MLMLMAASLASFHECFILLVVGIALKIPGQAIFLVLWSGSTHKDGL